MSQVGSSDEFDLSCTYLHLFRNKYSKYKLRTFLIFLMASRRVCSLVADMPLRGKQRSKLQRAASLKGPGAIQENIDNKDLSAS